MKESSSEQIGQEISNSLSEIKGGIGKLAQGLLQLSQEESKEWKDTVQEKCEEHLGELNRSFGDGAAKVAMFAKETGQTIRSPRTNGSSKKDGTSPTAFRALMISKE